MRIFIYKMAEIEEGGYETGGAAVVAVDRESSDALLADFVHVNHSAECDAVIFDHEPCSAEARDLIAMAVSPGNGSMVWVLKGEFELAHLVEPGVKMFTNHSG
jgi:hypothetical protein